MARGIIFKNNGINELSDTPTGYKYLGYDGESLSEKNGATVSSIGGGFVHYLGEDFGGGIIYHLYKGSDGLEHGLIVSKTESSAVWQASGTLTGADRTEDGSYNTGLMTSSAAATYVTGLTAGGNTDWYLPSIDELELLRDSRFSTNKALRAGGFTLLLTSLGDYWSSTEYNGSPAAQAFVIWWGDRTTKNSPKVNTNRVRAIRYF